ncbi:tail fiber assembly protein, partial [Xenorhabdus cabanillasii]
MKNYYFDETKSYRPFTFITEASPGSYAPDNAIRIEPPTREGYWPCLIDGQWQLLPDHRGKIVYSITTRQSLRCEEVIMPEGYTDLVPGTVFDNWDGKQWVTDIAAQQEYEIQQAEYEKRQLLRAAT